MLVRQVGPILADLSAMKKWKLWLIGVFLVLTLVLRLVYSHVNTLAEEKAWYISQLHYDFSARVDSMVFHNRAFLTVTRGSLDANREWQLKDRLHAHGMLHLIIQRERWYDLRVPEETLADDSIYVNSENDLLSVYRKGELIVRQPLSTSLRQRPF